MRVDFERHASISVPYKRLNLSRCPPVHNEQTSDASVPQIMRHEMPDIRLIDDSRPLSVTPIAVNEWR